MSVVALGGLYGWAALDTVLAANAYTSIELNSYDSAGNIDGDKRTTADDVAKLLTSLYNELA